MADITFPIQVNLPDDWVEQIIDRLRNDPDADWVDVTRCKDCTYWMPHTQLGYDEDDGTYHDYCANLIPEDEYYAFARDADDFCSRGVRRSTDERKTK